MSYASRARLNWGRIQAGDLSKLGDLMLDLFGHDVSLAVIPATEGQLSSAMHAYGRQAREEVSHGNLTGALRQISFMVGREPQRLSWESFGIPQQQVLMWIRVFAEQAYSAMLTERRPEKALVLLDLPYYQNWDNLLGRGADERIADATVEWANDCYTGLMDVAANPTDALKAAVDLRDRASIWEALEQSVRRGGDPDHPTTTIYGRLDFTVDDCEARITFWALLAEPE